MQFAQILLQIRKLFGNLSIAKKITLVSLIAGTFLGFFFLMTWSGQHDYQYLYSNLDPQNAGSILSYLKEKKVPYQISGNGTAILIPSGRISETRMALAAEGLPEGSGVGFEVFDNTKLGMTEFVQNVNYQRALQGELARSISKISEVETARVHLVIPKKSLFIENEEPATASVVLKMRRGSYIDDSQIQGIVHLVSSSVPRLRPEQVTVVDSSGKLLAGHDADNSVAKLSSSQLEYQEKLERNLEHRVKTMLEKALGHDNAVVRLSCDLDFRRQEMTEEMYFPDNRVVRSEQRYRETSSEDNANAAGVPGVRSNIAKRPEASAQSGRNEFSKQDRTVNYEIGKRTSHVVEPTATLKRVSAAVVVDGTYQRLDQQNGQVEWQYVERTPDEMQKLQNIVKGAINFNAERGDMVEVVNIPFETEKLAGPVEAIQEAGWLDKLEQHADHIKYFLFGLFLLFSFMFVVRPLTKWLTASTINEIDMLQQLPKTVGELESEYAGKRSGMPNTLELDRMLSADQKASVDVMRNWIKET